MDGLLLSKAARNLRRPSVQEITLPVGNYLSRNVNTKTCISGDTAFGPMPTGNEGAAWGTNGT
jgi:hypothetical protein